MKVNDEIQLSALNGDDKEALYNYLRDGVIHQTTRSVPYPYLREDAEEYCELARQLHDYYGHPVLYSIRKNDEFIGCFNFADLEYNHKVEIGYWIGQPFWGQGIMTQVIGVGCLHAFHQWNVYRIAAYVFDTNVGSSKALMRNGFECEAVLEKYFKKQQEFHDAKVFTLVR